MINGSKKNINILLIKPKPDADQFGLAPFFQTEPLGLEYLSSMLGHEGYSTTILDMRFERRNLVTLLKKYQPRIVGIACLHTIDVSATMRMADKIKSVDPTILIVIGGHAASVYPQVFFSKSSIDVICLGESEIIFPQLVQTFMDKKDLTSVPSLIVRNGNNRFERTHSRTERLELHGVDPPDRLKISRYQKHYCCLNYMPVWTIETTRGCYHRCKFCSVWQFYNRSCRFHSPMNVKKDFQSTGGNIFIVDDIFWADPDISDELATILLEDKTAKNWILVQSRADNVVKNYHLLKKWRSLAKNFDIFFGFESPVTRGLDDLNKDCDVETTVEAINLARELGYGVTGNFIIDPGFKEDDFKILWDFLEQHQLYRVGFTILTPLPGTYYFQQQETELSVFDWNQYDLHHLLKKPRLEQGKFWELYCETWRRTVLNLAGRKKWTNWLKNVKLSQVTRLFRILYRTQKLMDPKMYLAATKYQKEKHR